MFSKISQLSKNLTEEISRNMNETSDGESNGIRRTGSLLGRRVSSRTSSDTAKATNELKNGSAILQTETPDANDMTQPEDEPVEGERVQSESAKEFDTSVPSQEASRSSEANNKLSDLAPEIRSKMKKFAKYEEKYPILLDAYKVEKRKTELISSFEKVLREHTPVSTISDAGSLVEYLKSLQDKTNMLNQEMRRMAGENSTLTKAKTQNEQRLQDLENELSTLKETVEKNNSESNETIFNASDELESGNKEKLDSLSQEIVRKDQLIEKLENQNSENMVKISTLETSKRELEDLNSKLHEKESVLLSQIDAKSLELNKLVEANNSDISDSKQKIDSLETDLRKANECFIKLISESKTKEEEGLALKAKMTDFEKVVEVKDEQIIALKTKITQLEDAIEAKDKRLKQVESAASEYLNETADAPVTLTDLSEPATPTQSKKKNNKKKKKKGANFSANSDQNVKETETLQDEASLSNVSDIQSNEKFKKLKEEYNQLEGTIKSSQFSLNELNSLIEKKNGELEKLTNDFESLKENYYQAKRDSSIKDEEITNLRDMLKDLGDDLVTAKNEIKMLNSNENDIADDSKKKMKSLIAEIDGLKIDNEHLKSDKSNFEQKLKSTYIISKESEVKLRNSEKEMGQLTQKLDSQNAELKSLQSKFEQERKALQGKIESYENASKTSKESKQAASKLINELRETSEKLEEELKKARSDFQNSRKDNESLTKKLDELNKFKSNDTSLKLEIATMKISIDHKDKMITDYSSKIDFLTEAKDKLIEQISDFKVVTNELKNSNKVLEKENKSLITRTESLNNDILALDKEINKLSVENQDICNEMDTLKKRISETVKSNSDSLEEAVIFKKQCDELTMKSKEYIMRIETLEEEITESRHMLQERTREASTMRQMLVDSEEQSKGNVLSLKNELSKLKEEKEEIENATNVVVNRRKRELDEAKSLNDDLKEKLSKLQRSHATLENKLNDLATEKRVSIDSSISGARDSFSSPEFAKTIEILRDQLKTSNKKIKDYEHNTSILRKLNDESNLKFERLSKNYKFLSQQYKVLKTNSVPAPGKFLSDNLSIPDTSTNEESGPNSRRSSVSVEETNTQTTNIPYIKNVLLGFLEHKEQRNQLLPVIKTLLLLNNEDEQRFLSSLK